jgi:hypothetical protein
MFSMIRIKQVECFSNNYCFRVVGTWLRIFELQKNIQLSTVVEVWILYMCIVQCNEIKVDMSRNHVIICCIVFRYVFVLVYMANVSICARLCNYVCLWRPVIHVAAAKDFSRSHSSDMQEIWTILWSKYTSCFSQTLTLKISISKETSLLLSST